jgi:ligand-binding sensor domain-containing protein
MPTLALSPVVMDEGKVQGDFVYLGKLGDQEYLAASGWKFYSSWIDSRVPEGQVQKIVGTRSGSVWFAYSDKLGNFNSSEWQVFPYDVHCIKVDSHENVWIITEEGEIKYFDGIDWLNFEIPLLMNTSINAKALEISESEDYMWFGYDGGLLKYDKGEWSIYECLENLCFGVEEIAITNDMKVWMRTRTSIIEFDGENFNRVTPEENYRYISELSSVPDGSIWFSGSGIVTQIKDGKWTRFSLGVPLTSLYVTQEGSVWVGSLDSFGLAFLKGQEWITIDGYEVSYFIDHERESYTSFPFRGVFSIYEDINGDIWLATELGIVVLESNN